MRATSMVEVTSSPKPQTKSFLLTISVALALLTKGASRLSRRPKAAMRDDDDWKIELRTPKSLLSKALFPFVHSKKKKNHRRREGDSAAQSWGDGGVWQKEILMGGKCEPLDFSGVIYYDSTGIQTSELPLKSPRAHLPSHQAK